MLLRCVSIVALLLALISPEPVLAAAPVHAAEPYQTRPVEDDVIYFLLPDRFENGDPSNDRGGIEGTRIDHGFDPTDKAFYHGGDLAGLTARLDYIAGLGATAIWLAPVYKNKPVQPHPGGHSAAYHGYWITDFTAVDPHFGSRDELRAFVEAAHARNMKVFMDIITNHTADVIQYRECHDPAYDGPDREGPFQACIYRDKAHYPYWTRGAADGEPINEGFLGDRSPHQTQANFDRLTRSDYAYTPFVPEAEQDIKVPVWLNELRYYHNRGETTFKGENSLYGDFFGLDDLFTAHPQVRDGFIEIYKDWITELRVDGFRIDTARHVNPAFWRAFVPAMLDHARAEGIPNFYVFGEVYDPDPATLARFTHVDGFPTVLDFAFQSTVTEVISQGAGTDRLTRLFKADAVYRGGAQTAQRLPTFLGNHDMGRFAHFVRRDNPDLDDREVLARVRLAHGLMIFARGVPVIYSGSEQGFAGDGHDQDARENMFPSQVAVYNDNDLVGTDATTAEVNFDTEHPLYQAIARMTGILHAEPVLRRGLIMVRGDSQAPGLFAFSRLDPETGTEVLVALNTSRAPVDSAVEVEPASRVWDSVLGRCAATSTATGSVRVAVPALDLIVCRARP